jgi:DNA-binding CsgD family transcriptional regulator
LIASIGRDDFGAAALSSLNLALPLDSWSIYRVYRRQPPKLHESGSYLVPDTTVDCFRAYQRGLYQADSSFDDARARAASSGPLMTHLRAEELPAAHRDRIYSQHGMRERISLILPDQRDDSLVAINLYRHLHQRPFELDDFEVVQTAAPMVLACVERHLQLVASNGGPAAAEPPPQEPHAAGLERIVKRCPSLTQRELQICERLLRGWTHDGIAADLQLSVTTVKTYRNRAFDRLGIHFRSELFNLALQPEPAR